MMRGSTMHGSTGIAAFVAGLGVLFPSPARADSASVCASLGGLWSERSEFVQITGRPACELTPETPEDSFLQLQFEYPADAASDPASAQQLTQWIKSRVQYYQQAIKASGSSSEVAVGVTFEEQTSATSRTVVFTETAFTKGVAQPRTQKVTQTFGLTPTAPPEGAPPEGSAPPGVPAAPAVPPILGGPQAPPAGTGAPPPTTSPAPHPGYIPAQPTNAPPTPSPLFPYNPYASTVPAPRAGTAPRANAAPATSTPRLAPTGVAPKAVPRPLPAPTTPTSVSPTASTYHPDGSW